MTDEPNLQFHKEKNWRDLYSVSPGLKEALDSPRTEKEAREQRKSLWDTIKRATHQSTNKEAKK